MAVITKLITYHSSGVTAPASLLDGQQGHNDNLGVLYIGSNGGASIQEIGGIKYTQGTGWTIKGRNAAGTGYITDINAATLAGANFLDLDNNYLGLDGHTRGDIFTVNSAGDIINLGVGSNGHVLTSDGTDVGWQAGAAGSFAGLSDTTITTPANGDVPIYNGGAWVNDSIDVTLTGDITGSASMGATGTISIATTYNNDVVLGTDTSGNYVQSISGTTNEIEITGGTPTEGGTPQIGFPTDVTMPGDLSITGDLTVNGTTTTVDSDTVTIADPIFTLGSDGVTTVDTKDRGIEFKYGNGAGIDTGFFGFDRSTGYFTFIPDGTNTSETFSGTLGSAEFLTYRSTATTGTAPLVVASTTLVSNLNADRLDSQHGTYYLDYNNFSNTPTIYTTLDGLTDTTITSNSSGEILKWSGSAWINNTLAEAGIAASGHNHDGTYNPTIGIDTDLDTSNAQVIDTITLTDGVIQGITTRNLTVTNLHDVTITSNSSGEILKWNGAAWINNTLTEAGIAATGHNHSGTYNETIGTDTDLNTSGAQVIDEIVMTDGVITSAITTRTLTPADIGAPTSLDGLSDTTITGPATSDVLQWSGSAWVDRTLAEAGIAASGHNHTLDSLSNTTITSNTSGEILKWNGSAWINNTLAEAGIAASGHNHTLDSLSNTTITSVSSSDFIKWNGSAWVNTDTIDGGTW